MAQNLINRPSAVLLRFIEEAQQWCLGRREETIPVYLAAAHFFDIWRQQQPLPKRDMASIVLEPSTKDSTIQHLETFFSGRDLYRACGKPFRTSLLFYGPPGTGKTSFIQGIASKYSLPLYYLILQGMGDAELLGAVSKVPRYSVMVIEDIDTAVVQWGAEGDATGCPTGTGLLNAIDGLFSGDGRILIMTANDLSKLNYRLLRPGRIDRQVMIGNASQSQAKKLFCNVFKALEKGTSEKLGDQAERFAELIPGGEKSPASIQTFLLDHTSPEQALGGVAKWLEMDKNIADEK